MKLNDTRGFGLRWVCCASLAGLAGLPAATHAAGPSTIVGGTEAGPCQWAAVVALTDPGESTPFCSGTLIAPGLVLTAAHCASDSPVDVIFGELVASPTHTITADCVAHPDFEMFQPGDDVAFCVLRQPAPVTPIPPLAGCEADGIVEDLPLTIVGYGAVVADPATGLQGHGIKRIAELRVLGTQPRDREFTARGEDQGPCVVDSGGPALLELPDGSWRVAGVVSRSALPGAPQPGENICELVDFITYGAVWQQLEWLENISGLDVTPCHDADGTWAPTEACDGFPLDPGAVGATWATECAGEVSGPGQLCGPPFDEGGSDTGDPTTGADSSGGPEDPSGTGDPPDGTTTDVTADPTTAGTTADAGTDVSSDSGGANDPEADGCACTSQPGRRGGAALLGLVVLGLLRRRGRGGSGRYA